MEKIAIGCRAGEHYQEKKSLTNFVNLSPSIWAKFIPKKKYQILINGKHKENKRRHLKRLKLFLFEKIKKNLWVVLKKSENNKKNSVGRLNDLFEEASADY